MDPTTSQKLKSPSLAGSQRPISSFKQQSTAFSSVTDHDRNNLASDLNNLVSAGRMLGREATLPIQLNEESPSNDKLCEMSSSPDCRKSEIRRIVNLRFARIVDSAIDHFSYKKKQEIEDTKAPLYEERRSLESDSIDEGNETLDKEEFSRKKREIQDLRREIAAKERSGKDQQNVLLRLAYDVNSLRGRVQDPFAVIYGYNMSRLRQSLRNKSQNWIQNWRKRRSMLRNLWSSL